jgi:hypothetical protein
METTCPSCDNKFPRRSHFCPHCGALNLNLDPQELFEITQRIQGGRGTKDDHAYMKALVNAEKEENDRRKPPKPPTGSFLLALIVIAILYGMFRNSIPTLFAATATPTQRPTRTPLPPKEVSTKETCHRWDEITPFMDGKDICVYGTVQAIYPTDETWTRIRFTNQPNSFFMFSQLFIFPDLKAGDCIKANGKVQLYESIPYIESDDLYYCESWMK